MALEDAKSQSLQLVAAISLAYCQPAVGAFFNFELYDEHRLGGWQSGVLYANGVRKAWFATFKRIAALSAAGVIDCSTVQGAHDRLDVAAESALGNAAGYGRRRSINRSEGALKPNRR
jgi:hypothetical protein